MYLHILTKAESIFEKNIFVKKNLKYIFAAVKTQNCLAVLSGFFHLIYALTHS